MRDRPGRALSLLVESVMIVVSILAAFAIEAWWDDRGQRSIVRAQHAQLVTQTERNKSELVLAQARFTGALDGMDAFDRAIRPRPDDLTGDSVAVLFDRMMQMDAARLENGALDAILSQGELVEPADAELQAMLITYRRAAEFYESEHVIAEVAREKLIDRFVELAPLAYLGSDRDPALDFEFPVSTVLSDRALESRVRNLSIRLRRVLRTGKTLIQEADAILARLEPGAI